MLIRSCLIIDGTRWCRCANIVTERDGNPERLPRQVTPAEELLRTVIIGVTQRCPWSDALSELRPWPHSQVRPLTCTVPQAVRDRVAAAVRLVAVLTADARVDVLNDPSREAGKEVASMRQPADALPPTRSDAGSRPAVLDAADIARALTRIAHEILERTKGADDVVLLGIPTRGVPLAAALAARSTAVEGSAVPVGSLDVTMYRDDLRLRPARALGRTEMPAGGIDGRLVVLVDDVLFSGRTVRAALDALGDLGRPARGPARRPGRPRPPRAADPRRLRRQEPAHLARARRVRVQPRPRPTARDARRCVEPTDGAVDRRGGDA